jgi:hypothetical protein
VNTTIHELRNQLAIATANIEGILDGTLAPTQVRLETVHHALIAIEELLNESRAREEISS